MIMLAFVETKRSVSSSMKKKGNRGPVKEKEEMAYRRKS